MSICHSWRSSAETRVMPGGRVCCWIWRSVSFGGIEGQVVGVLEGD